MSSPIKVLHIIQFLSRGGAARSMAATAKYSSKLGGVIHSVISLTPPEEEAVDLVRKAGMSFIATNKPEAIYEACACADIVQIEWWSCPEVLSFFMMDLPPMRLLIWSHVAGDRAPQMMIPELVDFADITLASSPHGFRSEALQKYSAQKNRIGMIYDAADFERLDGITLNPHEGFNVGYIGTVHFLKMHPDYIKMCAAVKVPNSKFIVCGSGGHEQELLEQAQEIGFENQIVVKGYIEDIKSEIAEFDVYGYPLCEDTYASAELNLQEVMFAGVTPVVFPYGGVRDLVINDFTGIVVNTAQEYSSAIEYLYNNPAERVRMGANATLYAKQIFGAKNAGKKFWDLYKTMIQEPKRTRKWSHGVGGAASDLFIATLGSQGEIFYKAKYSQDLVTVLKVEKEIRSGSELMMSGGVLPFKRHHPEDPYLHLWSGLLLLNHGRPAEALIEFSEAINRGIAHQRVLEYLAEAAKAAGQEEIYQNARARLEEMGGKYSEFEK